MARRRRPSKPPTPPRPLPEGELPSLAALEQFSEASIAQWLQAAEALTALQTQLFFGLELSRQQHTAELVEAIKVKLVPSQPFEGWARIVEYRYCLEPLSVAGAIKGDGGRFNIGSGLDQATFPSFPALYIAEDYPTSFRERFGMGVDTNTDGLSSTDLALRVPTSFTHVALRGQLELIIDVADTTALQPFSAVLKQFAIPNIVRLLSRRLNLRAPPMLVRSAAGLQKQLIHPNWRMFSAQFDLPSNSQIFGRIAAAAGAHGIRYPSARQSGKFCMALFPQNWRSSSSFVEISDGAPSEARLTRMDGKTTALW